MSDYLRHNVNIRDDEDILRVIRRAWVTFLGHYILLFLLIIGPFFFIVPLFRMEIPGILLFFGTLFVGILLSFRTFLMWYFNALIITTERIIDIDQTGFFDRTVSEAQFVKISDVSFRRRGVWQTLFRYGSVTIQTHGSNTQLIVHGIQEPERVQEIILKSVEHVHMKSTEQPVVGGQTTDSDVQALLKVLREKIGDDRFEELVHKTTTE